MLLMAPELSSMDSLTPKLVAPAKVGIFFLLPSTDPIRGTRLLLTSLLMPRMASAVLFLAPPRGPGHPSHPSRVSLRSPSHTGKGSQVPSLEQIESISAPVLQSNWQRWFKKPCEQYPGIAGQRPGICSSTPGSCSTHRGISVHVPSSWQRGTLFLPKLQTTLHVCPGKDSEQYPGKPGQVVKAFVV